MVLLEHFFEKEIFWYCALRQALQVMNCIPCTVEWISTTHQELVYGTKPDPRVLLHLLSSGYFEHLWDSLNARSGTLTSKSK